MARRLGPKYRHVQTSFSTAVMHAHAVTLDVEPRPAGDAVRTANRFDANEIPPWPGEVGIGSKLPAHHQRDDRDETYALLDAAERTAPETIRFNGYACEMLLRLAAAPPGGLRATCARCAAGWASDCSERVGVQDVPGTAHDHS